MGGSHASFSSGFKWLKINILYYCESDLVRVFGCHSLLLFDLVENIFTFIYVSGFFCGCFPVVVVVVSLLFSLYVMCSSHVLNYLRHLNIQDPTKN